MEKFCNALLAHLTGKWNKPTSCNTVKYSFALPARYYHVWQLEYTFIFPTMPQARLTEKNPWQVFISVVFSSRNFVPRLRLLPLDVYQLFALCLGLSNISNDTHDKRQSKHTQKMLKAERVNNEKHSQTKRCTASHIANKNKMKLCINARTQTEVKCLAIFFELEQKLFAAVIEIAKHSTKSNFDYCVATTRPLVLTLGI